MPFPAHFIPSFAAASRGPAVLPFSQDVRIFEEQPRLPSTRAANYPFARLPAPPPAPPQHVDSGLSRNRIMGHSKMRRSGIPPMSNGEETVMVTHPAEAVCSAEQDVLPDACNKIA
jgi:hypothetical protein